ncbi:Pantoate--beta-alanine ligase [hydrothermal vent metagenome]|uniref:pantoate--beta-alanine ligase (AMP-forming) n=1 Tax=hydrothermal vent metagenome TaxID=652676 RepID=A0A3B1CPD6_9ZZZZ
MKIVKTPAKISAVIGKERRSGKKIGLVPTLGYLHAGHEALIKRARKESDIIVLSSFVNPLQFRKKAYEAYPRDLERDLAICEKLKVNYLFLPDAKDIYPDGFDTYVEVKDLAGSLEGASIRWHYKAVTTIVAKLFNMIYPDKAYFGKKDPHQLILIKRMVADLNFPVKIVAVPTRRAKDGVALSSRNSLLTLEERHALQVLPSAIKKVGALVMRGEKDRSLLTKTLVSELESEKLVTVDFTAVVDEATLLEDKVGSKTLIYAAVFIGGKRLTDNIVVKNR